MDKTVVGVTTLEGNDVLIYSDGSMSMATAIAGANGQYVLIIPMDIQTTLKAEDVSNPDLVGFPGYVVPAAADSTEAAGGDVASATQ